MKHTGGSRKTAKVSYKGKTSLVRTISFFYFVTVVLGHLETGVTKGPGSSMFIWK
jgi:hypothetical protein